MSLKIPGDVQEDSRECSKMFWAMFQNIPWKVPEDSQECSKDSKECRRRFQGMLKKSRIREMFQNIPSNVRKDSGECSRRIQVKFEKILGNVCKNSGECSRRFWEYLERFQGVLKKIPWNAFNFKLINNSDTSKATR